MAKDDIRIGVVIAGRKGERVSWKKGTISQRFGKRGEEMGEANER